MRRLAGYGQCKPAYSKHDQIVYSLTHNEGVINENEKKINGKIDGAQMESAFLRKRKEKKNKSRKLFFLHSSLCWASVNGQLI